METLKYWKWLLIGLVLVMFMACGGGSSSSGSSDVDNALSLELGETNLYDTIPVGTTGSLVSINLLGDPLDGFQLGIPNGSYDEEIDVTISYTPIVSHSGNKYFDPVTPLISVKNGAEYSDEIMTMKIPVEMEEGYHYMAFYYDETTGKLEGIPDIERDENSITIATRHFSNGTISRADRPSSNTSNVVVSRAEIDAILAETFESDFEVEKDGWPFENPGTYLSSGGICSGMSRGALYYYTEKKKKRNLPNLFESYDSDTPKIEEDDDQAIKLCSVIQDRENTDDERQWENIQYDFKAYEKKDVNTFFLFTHALMTSKEPQYVGIYTGDFFARDYNSSKHFGHAMVVYKKVGNELFIYDPNYPKDATRKIELEWENIDEAKGTFKPYGSYPVIYFYGQSAYFEDSFDILWEMLDEKNMDGFFPSHEFYMWEPIKSTRTLLGENFETTEKSISIDIEANTINARITGSSEEATIYNNDSAGIEVTLKEGANKIGILIEAKVDNNWTWSGYKYFNIELDEDDSDSTTKLDCDKSVCPCIYDELLYDPNNKPPNSATYWVDNTACTYEFSLRPFNLRSAMPYLNGERHGMYEGFYYRYEEAGNIQYRTEFFNDERNGKSMYFKPSGEMTSCYNYVNGVKKDSCMP